MRRWLSLIGLLLLAPSVLSAQKTCKKGIPCGGTCIAANKVCRIGTARSTPAPASTAPAPQAATRPTPETSADEPASTKVWVNRTSHVYHCPGSRWYGATKNGVYMTEKAAKAAGNRAAYGRACGS